jgi:peptidoglycan-associated lipoprotein
VFFDFDRSDLTPEAQDTIEKVAAWLKTYPDVTLTVEGHCDERGTREYNLALGERRANSVTSYMVALGIDANRVSNLSYGKERPAVLGSNEAAWAQNRRGVFIVN